MTTRIAELGCGDFVSNCIFKILASNDKMTMSKLSEELEIPYSTLIRMKNKEVKSPNLNFAMAITRKAYPSQSEFNLALEKLNSGTHKRANNIYEHIDKNSYWLKADANFYLSDSMYYQIMMLVISNGGVTQDQIKEQFGQTGYASLMHLKEKNIVIKEGDKFCINANDCPISAEQVTVYGLSQKLLSNNYDIESFGMKDNWLSVQFNAINVKKAAPKITSILRQANKDINNILQSEEYAGNDVYWVTLAADDLCNNIQNSSKETLQ